MDVFRRGSLWHTKYLGRSFLKGAAALAAATAASGLLTACGGGKNDSGFTIGKYKVYFDSPDFGTSDAQGNHFIEPSMKIECIKTDRFDGSRKFSKTFYAKIGDTELALSNGDKEINNHEEGRQVLVCAALRHQG